MPCFYLYQIIQMNLYKTFLRWQVFETRDGLSLDVEYNMIYKDSSGNMRWFAYFIEIYLVSTVGFHGLFIYLWTISKRDIPGIEHSKKDIRTKINHLQNNLFANNMPSPPFLQYTLRMR